VVFADLVAPDATRGPRAVPPAQHLGRVRRQASTISRSRCAAGARAGFRLAVLTALAAVCAAAPAASAAPLVAPVEAGSCLFSGAGLAVWANGNVDESTGVRVMTSAHAIGVLSLPATTNYCATAGTTASGNTAVYFNRCTGNTGADNDTTGCRPYRRAFPTGPTTALTLKDAPTDGVHIAAAKGVLAYRGVHHAWLRRANGTYLRLHNGLSSLPWAIEGTTIVSAAETTGPAHGNPYGGPRLQRITLRGTGTHARTCTLTHATYQYQPLSGHLLGRPVIQAGIVTWTDYDAVAATTSIVRARARCGARAVTFVSGIPGDVAQVADTGSQILYVGDRSQGQTGVYEVLSYPAAP